MNYLIMDRDRWDELIDKTAGYGLLVRLDYCFVAENDGTYTVIKDRSGKTFGKETINDHQELCEIFDELFLKGP